MSHLRANPIRSQLEDGNLVIGAETKTRSLEVIELLGDIGFDFIWLDLEHGGPSPFDGPRLENYQRAAEAAGTTVMLRLPGGDPHMIRKTLDCGIRTLLIPRVESAAEVQRCVKATRFSYKGEPGDRGIGTARGSRWGRDLDDHATREDNAVCLGVMIENETAVDVIDDILSVSGLGFVFVGPADLSVSLGEPLETDAPIVREHVDRVVDAATDAGVPVGRIAYDRDGIEENISQGCTIVRAGNELEAIQQSLGSRLEGFL